MITWCRESRSCRSEPINWLVDVSSAFHISHKHLDQLAHWGSTTQSTQDMRYNSAVSQFRVFMPENTQFEVTDVIA